MSGIEDWVKKQLDAGYTAKEVKECLADSGYDPNIVHKILVEKTDSSHESSRFFGRSEKIILVMVFMGIISGSIFYMLNPQSISLKIKSIEIPREIKPNDSFYVNISVKNVGGNPETEMIELFLDGRKVKEKEISMASGETRLISFHLESKSEGKHILSTGEKEKVFTITCSGQMCGGKCREDNGICCDKEWFEKGNCCSEEDCSSDKKCVDHSCKSIVTTRNFIASNNHEKYLGEEIDYSSPSDWKEYDPIVNKVKELTEDVETDRKKAERIATWVKHSYEYNNDDVSKANKKGSIIEIYNSESGVCLDSAWLTTAMLRLAGIPARSISPKKGKMHALTEAYINNEWLAIDSTFGSGEPKIYEMDKISYLKDYAGYTGKSYKFLVKSIPREGFGKVRYPFPSTINLNEKTGEKVYLGVPECGFSEHIFGNGTDKYEKIWSPGIYMAAHENEAKKNDVPEWITEDFYQSVKNGYYRNKSKEFIEGADWAVASFSPGQYRIECGFSAIEEDGIIGKDLIYAEFYVKKDSITEVTAQNFKIFENTDNEKIAELLIEVLKPGFITKEEVMNIIENP